MDFYQRLCIRYDFPTCEKQGSRESVEKGKVMLTGYARVSTEKQDLQAQREQLADYGVADGRIYF